VADIKGYLFVKNDMILPIVGSFGEKSVGTGAALSSRMKGGFGPSGYRSKIMLLSS